MNKRSKDYIPYEHELIAEREAAAERVKNIPDPRNKYLATYKINGTTLTEYVMAYSIKDAKDIIQQQLALVGWFPVGLQLESVENTNVTIK